VTKTVAAVVTVYSDGTLDVQTPGAGTARPTLTLIAGPLVVEALGADTEGLKITESSSKAPRAGGGAIPFH
jgi:hypothetical protein